VAETPIRGRWTIRPHPQSWPSWNYADGPRPSEPVQVVPVPDEAAIDRGAQAAFEARFLSDMRAVALTVLRAALDPDPRPETPEERHHRELHDGTLNEMPPEPRHA
jgi:hypothetical protein